MKKSAKDTRKPFVCCIVFSRKITSYFIAQPLIRGPLRLYAHSSTKSLTDLLHEMHAGHVNWNDWIRGHFVFDKKRLACYRNSDAMNTGELPMWELKTTSILSVFKIQKSTTTPSGSMDHEKPGLS